MNTGLGITTTCTKHEILGEYKFVSFSQSKFFGWLMIVQPESMLSGILLNRF